MEIFQIIRDGNFGSAFAGVGRERLAGAACGRIICDNEYAYLLADVSDNAHCAGYVGSGFHPFE